MVIIALEEGSKIEKVIIYGGYSDEVEIGYQGNVMKVAVKRFYKNEEIREQNSGVLNVRLIGFEGDNDILKVSTNG